MNSIKTYFKEQFQVRMLFLEHSKASDFYLSCWQKTRSSVPLLIWHVFLSLFALSIVLASATLYIKAGLYRFWFIYLTHWGITLIVITTGLAAAISARCYIYGPITAGAEFRLPWYVKLYWICYNITTPAAFFITLFYWTVLYDDGLEEELSHGMDVAVHGLNSVIMFLLLMSSGVPHRLVHVYQPLIFAVTYILFGVIYYVAGGVDYAGNPYVYIVVDWSKPGATIALLLVTTFFLFMSHFLVTGLTEARNAIARSLVEPSVTVHVDEGVPLRQR